MLILSQFSYQTTWHGDDLYASRGIVSDDQRVHRRSSSLAAAASSAETMQPPGGEIMEAPTPIISYWYVGPGAETPLGMLGMMGWWMGWAVMMNHEKYEPQSCVAIVKQDWKLQFEMRSQDQSCN